MGYIEDLRALIGHQPIILNGSCGIITNHIGKVLLQQRCEPQERWGLVGGLMEMGESTKQTLIREAKEETGLDLRNQSLHLFDIYSGGTLSVAANGDEFYSVTTVYVVPNILGAPHITNQESLAFDWFDPTNLPDNMVPRYRHILSDWQNQGRNF